jgi:predicted alpha-1,6-mannanase (GH76 family)
MLLIDVSTSSAHLRLLHRHSPHKVDDMAIHKSGMHLGRLFYRLELHRDPKARTIRFRRISLAVHNDANNAFHEEDGASFTWIPETNVYFAAMLPCNNIMVSVVRDGVATFQYGKLELPCSV